MKQMFRRLFSASLCLFGVACYGQTNGFEMPMAAERLAVEKLQIINRIPEAQSVRLPKTLPIFRYSAKPRAFSQDALQSLLNQSAFAGTNLAVLLRERSRSGEGIRLATTGNLNYFTVTPVIGGIVSYNRGNDVEPRRENAPFDAVPSFEAIRHNLFRYALAFGVSTNEMERKDDGSILLRKSDGQRSARGGAVKFMHRRSVGISRGIESRLILMNDDKIELEQGVDGRLLKFEMKWPIMEAVSTNRVFPLAEIVGEIKKGNVLAAVVNEYPPGGTDRIELMDIRVDYFDSKPSRSHGVSTNTDIYPVASIFAVFKSKKGQKTEGTLYAPLTESR